MEIEELIEKYAYWKFGCEIQFHSQTQPHKRSKNTILELELYLTKINTLNIHTQPADSKG